jgi:CheY-like chemotaxis protein
MPMGNGAQAKRGLKLLLVEDHAQLRSILTKTLVQSGYQVTVAESGDAAMALLKGGLRIDILLSDIRMPGRVGGIQLAEWLRAAQPSIPILLQTGSTDVQTGDFPVLRKPFMPDELLTMLESVLSEPALPAS